MGVLLAVLLLGATSCDWAQFGAGAGNTRSTPDSGLTQASLATTAPAFTGVTGGAIYSSPAVAGGVAYVTADDGKLYAFSATGASGCANNPPACQPLWTAPLAISAPGLVSAPAALNVTVLMSSPAVAGGEVLVGSSNGYLEAFDAAGSRNCSGTPTVCTPLWTGQTGGAIVSSPLANAGVVYVGSADGKLYAFDQAGVTNCVAGVCSPLWTGATGGAIDDSPAELGTSVYVGATDGKLYAFSLAGSTNCAGAPKVCTPLWTGTAGASITFSSPAVGSSGVYVGATDGKLYAFDPAGVTNCVASICSPLWTAATGAAIQASPAVSNNVVYIGSTDHQLYALDATGTTGCSGAPKVCTPLWTATTGGVIRSSPAVADNMVFVGSDDHHLYAYDAAGSNGCSGAPKACTPLWSAATGAEVPSSPAVANAEIYVGSRDHHLYAFKPWTFSRLTCPTVSGVSGFGPCQLQDAYELPSFAAGSGRTVAIVDANDDPKAEADLAVYRSTFGLPACTTANECFTKLNQSGHASPLPSADSGWAEEISLDLDMVSAICPLCHITLLEANGADEGSLEAAEHTAAATAPVAISDSWGGGESSSDLTANSAYIFAGITTVASAGDNGYGPSFPATLPGVVAVGATTLTATTANARGWTERAWNETGSGCSAYEPKPAWQTDTRCTKRTVNDVAADGDPNSGVAVYDAYGADHGWEVFGGTSASAPMIAGVYALAYPDAPMSTTYASTASLFDVTAGSNGSCAGTYLCTAGVGYDGPTGMGTPCGTAAFGTGPFVSACAASSSSASLGARGSNTAPTVGVGVTPACGQAPPGQMRCFALKVTSQRGT
jgi:outer membrane protein assembly factor BamB